MIENPRSALLIAGMVAVSLVFLTFARPWTWAVNAMATIAMALFSALLWRTTRENSRLQEAFISMQLYLDAGDEITRLEEKLVHLRSAIAHFERALDALSALAAEEKDRSRVALRSLQSALLAARHPVLEVELAQATASGEGGQQKEYRTFSRNLDHILAHLEQAGEDGGAGGGEVFALARETLPAARVLQATLQRSIGEHGEAFQFQAERAKRASLHIQDVLRLGAGRGPRGGT